MFAHSFEYLQIFLSTLIFSPSVVCKTAIAFETGKTSDVLVEVAIFCLSKIFRLARRPAFSHSQNHFFLVSRDVDKFFV